MRTLAQDSRRAQSSMKRCYMALATAVSLTCCGPDTKPRQQCAGKPDFIVTVSAASGLLPDDTTVVVTFGGDGHENYRPNAHNERQVLFCDATRAPSGSGGEGGADSSDMQALAGAGGTSADVATISAISCELWTGGPASVRVQASGWTASQALTPKTDTCTVWNSIVLGPTNSP